MSSLYRTFWILSRTPVIPPQSSSLTAGVPLTTFRTYTTSKDEETAPTSPDTDEIAHTEEAFKHGSDPEESKKGVENETGESMQESAADSRASRKPNGAGPHNVSGSKKGPKVPSADR